MKSHLLINEPLKSNHASVRHVVNMSDLVREDRWEEEDYWVIPTVLMAEGVHNGLFYSAEALADSVDGWNGEPVVVWHPKKDGVPITANNPKTLTEYKVGQIFNCSFEDNKLKGEAWISKTRCEAVSGSLLKLIQDGARIEVSTGVFVKEAGEAGVWNGEPFRANAVEHKPDHLAMLPGGKGACSWEDGGGAPRLNEQGKPQERGGFWASVKKLFTVNSPSHDEVRGMLSNAVRKARTLGADSMGPYIVDVYNDHFIYELPPVGQDGAFQLFKQNYSVGADDSVSLSGDPLEVRLQREYVPATPATNTEGDASMRKDTVDALITSETSRWGEESRSFLMGLEDDAFARVVEEQPVVKTNVEEPPAEQPAKVEEPAKKDETTPTQAPAQINVSQLPLAVQRAVKREEAYTADLIKGLVANKRCLFTQEQLAAKDLDELETLAKMVDVDVSYEGRSTGAAIEHNADDQMTVPKPLTLNFVEEQQS